MNTPLLQMKNISKQFFGVYVLKNVNFELERGEVHVILGENGAGKSTLMKILGGIYHMDEGEIYIEGKKVSIRSVDDAKKAGISIIHQELSLVPYLTVAENIFLGREHSSFGGFINKKAMFDEAQRLLDSFGVNIKAEEVVEKLSGGEQQIIEIVRAVSFNAKIVVMDEPTSYLTDKEVRFLFNVIEDLKQREIGIIYISHRMAEIFEIGDRVTVLRDGHYIATKKVDETNTDELVSLMVGRKLTTYYTRNYHKTTETVLEVKNIGRAGVFKNVSFDLKKGEILGFAGLMGAGRSEVMRAIFGLEPIDSGEIYVNGKKVEIRNPLDAIKNGIALVPENRKVEGLFLNECVRFNLTIRILEEFIKGIIVRKKKEDEITSQYINKLFIKAYGEQMVRNLSGGNQQKVVLARWLATNPKILILDEPTRGIDVGAKAEIYKIMDELVSQGISIIMVSSELPELINMCDRIVVMANRTIGGILDRTEFSQEKIMHYAVGRKEYVNV